MKIRYWGTAAAEGIPCLFCNCAVCKEAREKKGKYVRTRSQVMLDNRLLIDFNADTYMHALQYDCNLADIEHVLITHVHADHFYPAEIGNRAVNFANGMAHETLTLHGSADVAKHSQGLQYMVKQKRLAYDEIQPYESRSIEGFTVTALPATHGTENPYVYLFEKEGKTFFLFNDSGFLKEEGMAWLKEKQIAFDAISYDCTFGERDASFGGTYEAQHLGIPNILEQRKRFIENGNYREHTVEILTHFSHNVPTIGYGDMLKIARQHGFVLAYDGMETKV